MTCRYCGVETGSGVGHRSQAECIKALSEEIDRAKRLINSSRQASADRVGEKPQPPGEHRGLSR